MLAHATEGRIDRLGATRDMDEQLAELADQVAPRAAIKIQSFQYRLATHGNPASFAAMELPACPIELLEIIVLRHRQESLVAASESRWAWDGTKFPGACRRRFQFDRCQKSVCCLR